MATHLSAASLHSNGSIAVDLDAVRGRSDAELETAHVDRVFDHAEVISPFFDFAFQYIVFVRMRLLGDFNVLRADGNDDPGAGSQCRGKTTE